MKFSNKRSIPAYTCLFPAPPKDKRLSLKHKNIDYTTPSTAFIYALGNNRGLKYSNMHTSEKKIHKVSYCLQPSAQ
jgi:hypothetical protein